MSVLLRTEDAYLNILRVFILTLATLAIVVTFIGLAFGGWFFFKNTGSGPDRAPPVTQVTLGDFMAGQKAAASTGAAPDSGAAGTTTLLIPETVDHAARNLVTYGSVRLHAALNLNELRKTLNATYVSIPRQYQAAYGESLEALTHQLVISTGAPLTGEGVDTLLKWHDDKFAAAIADEEASRTAKAASGLQLLTVGGAAFLAFLLVVFCFIFVKIERNLRTVKTLTKVVAQ